MAASLPAMTGSHCFEIREGHVLSFPPIINSREIGEVQVGDSELFVEVTGTDLAMVVLTLNIFAANLADRGATIAPVQINYPGKTSLGRSFVTPVDLGKARSIPLTDHRDGSWRAIERPGNRERAHGIRL